MTVVVDASVALKWYVVEHDTPMAWAVREGADAVIAPDLVIAEVCNAAWKAWRRKEIVATPGGGPEWRRDRPRRPLLRLQQRRLRVLLMRLIGSGRDSSGHGPGIGSGRGWR